MKFDDLLAQYLYEKRSLQLQGIGTFELDKAVSVPLASEKEIYYPIEGLTFSYNTKDVTNEDLITFLVKKLGKIQPLVRSDLDSYLSNIKQFINIGKPYTIEGIGTLHKNNQGTYEFTPGNFIPMKEELSPKREKNSEHSIRREEKKKADGRRGVAIALIVVASLAVLGGIGWGVYKFLYSAPATEEVVSDTAQSSPATVALPDSTSQRTQTDSTKVAASDSTTYKMIFEITPSPERAASRTYNLNKGKIYSKVDTIGTGVDLRYRLYLPMTLKPTDTLRVKDSLERMFVRKVRIVPLNP